MHSIVEWGHMIEYIGIDSFNNPESLFEYLTEELNACYRNLGQTGMI